ncbi:Tethering factor for nuclear proteasome sts1, partial [Pichia californica]
MGSTFHNQYSIENSSPSKEVRNNTINSKYNMSRKIIHKRKFSNDDFSMNIGLHNLDNNNNSNNNNNNFKNRYRIIKKQKNPSQIFGQKLPLNRIIETLNKEKLQNLINNLILENPELTSKILETSPKIEPEDALKELKRKIDLILINLPYKVESTSDYSFLRVKPLVNEFFQSLSDYSLNFIPPIENDLTISIKFLTKFLIEIFYKLPQFQAVEFKYFYNITVEKFNLIFNDNLIQFL